PGAGSVPYTTLFRSQPEVVTEMQEVLARLNAAGYAACCDALGQSDLRDEIAAITVPTLVLTGDADPVTTVDEAKEMQAKISGSEDRKSTRLNSSHVS